MADQKVMGEEMLKKYPIPENPLAKIFEYQEMFGSKFCKFRELAAGEHEEGERTEWKNVFLDCVQDECSEILNWIRWKHWKNYKDFELKPDELRFELIDVLHFLVSIYLVHGISSEQLVDLVADPNFVGNDLTKVMDTFRCTTGLKAGYDKERETRLRLRRMTKAVGDSYDDIFIESKHYSTQTFGGVLQLTKTLFELFIIWDMAPEDVYCFYMSKNQENFDRQERGY